jgi:CRISPR type IV-associated protein Csf2
MMRSTYVVALEITPTSPLTHGAGNRGNEQILRTTEYLLEVDDPELPGRKTARRVKIPVISGAAFKSTLREHAFGHMAETLGLGDGELDRDVLRLLLKGGKNDSGGQSVSLEEHRRLRVLFPLLGVFGSMDGGLPIRGQIKVSPIRPYCTELVDAGLLPTRVSAIEVGVDGEDVVSAPQIEVFPDRTPVGAHLIRTREEYFRHDMRTSPHIHLLEGEAARQIEDKAAARKGKVAKKQERREANESMPHAYQAIVPGTPMVATIRLMGATQVEWECLAYAIVRWIQHGAQLGGGTTKGHGQCQVRCAGALAYTPGAEAGAAPGTALSIDTAGSAYLAHLQEHAEAIRAELGIEEAA